MLAVDGQGMSDSVYIPAQHQKNAKVYGIVSNAPNGTFLSLGKLSPQGEVSRSA